MTQNIRSDQIVVRFPQKQFQSGNLAAGSRIIYSYILFKQIADLGIDRFIVRLEIFAF